LLLRPRTKPKTAISNIIEHHRKKPSDNYFLCLGRSVCLVADTWTPYLLL
jgi:hypothetical protein